MACVRQFGLKMPMKLTHYYAQDAPSTEYQEAYSVEDSLLLLQKTTYHATGSSYVVLR